METARDQLLRLADGSKVVVRAIRFEDGPKFQAFVRRLSARSRYLRFFAGLIELSAMQLERLLRVDSRRGLALVALSDQEPEIIVAEARCVLDRDGSAEFAVAVADEFQRKRLGTQLVNKLLAYASAKGVRRLFGEIMAENHGMLEFARRHGFQIRSNPADAKTLIAQRVPATLRGATRLPAAQSAS
jgi:acetyltransferase